MLDRSRGKVALYLAEKPGWHGLGTVTSAAKNSKEAMQIGQLDWLVEQWSLRAIAPEGSAHRAKPETALQNVSGQVLNVRSDTGAQLGVVSADYSPLQNHEMFDALDTIIEDGEALYESCGAVMGGKVVWAQIRI